MGGRAGGFGALQPKSRADEGLFRKLSAEAGLWLLSQVSQYPQIPLSVLYQRWKQSGKQLPSLRTVYRFLRKKGYDAASLRRGRLENGATKAFEAPFVNDLWMTDFSPGPKLRIDGKNLSTQLCLILDDHSRLITFGAYYAAADTAAFHHALKEAVQRRGIPYKLYTDLGRPFTNKHTQLVCANLGIRLLHAKPYAAWSKGKIERCFHSLQHGFETTLILPENRVESTVLAHRVSALRLRSHRALYSRIAAHVCIESLKPSELEAYLEHQLRQAGIERPCFEPAALDLLLASASEGIPRTINLLARAAWIEAAKEKALQISAAHLQSALELVPGVLEMRQNSSPR